MFGFHTAEATLDVLCPVFEDCIISHRADDLTPLGYYLWATIKDKCYADKPEPIALKNNIPKAIGEIQLHTIDNVLKNWTDRVDYSTASRGSHMDEIIFHYQPEGLYFQIKKEILRKYSVVFFKAFSNKKGYLADPVNTVC